MQELTRTFVATHTSPMELFGWLFLAAVGVIGTADYIKHSWFVNRKSATKWIVGVLSVISAVCATTLTPQWLGIAWLSFTVVISLAVLLKENVLDVVKKLMEKLK